MNLELMMLIIAVAGLIVAICAWQFPKLLKTKTASSQTPRQSPSQEPLSGAKDYRQQIEIALVHLKATTHDNEQTAYIVSLAKRMTRIELEDMSALISHLTHDSSKLKAVKGFSGKVAQEYSASEYEELMSKFTHSNSKQEVAKHLNQ